VIGTIIGFTLGALLRGFLRHHRPLKERHKGS
jgi:hypothetical protein